VAYPLELLSRLADGVKDKSLPPTDRAGLILDAFNLTKTGDIKGSDLLRLVKAYRDEDNRWVGGWIRRNE